MTTWAPEEIDRAEFAAATPGLSPLLRAQVLVQVGLVQHLPTWQEALNYASGAEPGRDGVVLVEGDCPCVDIWHRLAHVRCVVRHVSPPVSSSP